MAKSPAKKRAPATEVSGWSRVGTEPLQDGKLYLGHVNGRHVEVLHNRGEFFENQTGAFSLRVDGVTHVRERPADPVK